MKTSFLSNNKSATNLAFLFLLLMGVVGSAPVFAQTPAPAGTATSTATDTTTATGTSSDTSTDTATQAPAKEEAPAEDANKETLWIFLKKGGPTMVGLGVISTIILAFALERFFFFRRQKVNTKGFTDRVEAALNEGGLEALEKEIGEDQLLLARILKYGLTYKSEGLERVEKAIETQASVELGRLEKGLNLLNNLGNLAPLLGFFGTVTGMRNSFLQFVEKAAPTARDLAGGVEEALITTIAGLLVAMPAYFIYNMFLYYIDSLSIELEQNAARILERLK